MRPVVLAALCVCSFAADSDSVRDRIQRFVADSGNLERFYTVEISRTRSERFRKFYSDTLLELERIPFDSLDREGRADAILFRNYLRHELRQLDIDGKFLADAAPFLAFAQPIVDLVEARQRMLPVDGEKSAGILTTLLKQIESTRKEIESTLKNNPPTAQTRAVANRAAQMVNDLRESLKGWFAFYNTYDPIFSWWNAEPFKAADLAIDSYAAFLRERVIGLKKDDNTTIVGYPIGREALMSELQFEMIPYTPEELIDIAEKEWQWCESEMKRASNERSGMGTIGRRRWNS